jgi:hypothetical protein
LIKDLGKFWDFFCPHVNSTNFANFLGKFCQISINTKLGKKEIGCAGI